MFVCGHQVGTSLVVLLDMETAMHYSHQRNKLTAIVLHEYDLATAHFELRAIAYFHRFTVHSATEHSERVTITRRALDRVLYFEGDVAHNAMLRAFANPL